MEKAKQIKSRKYSSESGVVVNICGLNALVKIKMVTHNEKLTPAVCC